MNCPYCGVHFNLDGVNAVNSILNFENSAYFGTNATPGENDKNYTISSHNCPECNKQIIWLNETEIIDGKQREAVTTTLLFPKYSIKQIPPEIPNPFANDFREAHDVLPISPKACAALSRRCLQNLIREKENISEKYLCDEIQTLLKKNHLPRHLANDLDSIRQVGNFASHPIKDSNTGQIVEVEPGEAEWTLEVLEALLNFYFVDEPKSQERREALNRKLTDAGKGPMLLPKA